MKIKYIWNHHRVVLGKEEDPFQVVHHLTRFQLLRLMVAACYWLFDIPLAPTQMQLQPSGPWWLWKPRPGEASAFFPCLFSESFWIFNAKQMRNTDQGLSNMCCCARGQMYAIWAGKRMEPPYHPSLHVAACVLLWAYQRATCFKLSRKAFFFLTNQRVTKVGLKLICFPKSLGVSLLGFKDCAKILHFRIFPGSLKSQPTSHNLESHQAFNKF